MKYNLTEEQFDKLWQEDFEANRTLFFHIDLRKTIFKERFGDKITYSDSPTKVQGDYWGVIEGEEKHINLFLLKFL